MMGSISKKIKNQIRLLKHSGSKYKCPFCNYSAKELSTIGLDVPILVEKQVVGGGKRAAGCYKCASSDRTRLVYVYLTEVLKIFDLPKNKSILHIAPEKHIAKRLLDFGFDQYVCGDLFTEGYQYPAHVQNINILNIPFADNTFDLIICNHVLEHIPTDIAAMKELQRVLKKGGQAILQVPISKNSADTYEDFSVTEPKDRETAFGQFDHVRIYGQDYADRLTAAGFTVTRLNISANYAKYGLNKDEDIFIGKK